MARAAFPLFCAALAACAFSAPAEDSFAARRSEIRRIAGTAVPETRSEDGSLRVIAEDFGARSELLNYLLDLRSALEKKCGEGEFAGRACGVLLRIGVVTNAVPDGKAFGLSLGRYVEGESVLPPIIVDAASFADLDARALSEELTDALLRLKTLECKREGQLRAPQPPARFFARGLARSLDRATLQADFDSFHAKWTGGKHPKLNELLAALEKNPSPVASSELVQFWLSRPDPRGRLRRMWTLLGQGVPWSPDLFLETAVGGAYGDTVEKTFADYLEDRATRVLTPGVTTKAFIERALSCMRLVPGKFGVPAGYENGAPQPLERLLEQDNAEWAPETAHRLESEIMRMAAGRGDAFRAAAAEFAAVLKAIGDGKVSAADAATRIGHARESMRNSATE